ncbi:isopenicillin N synthase family dioxygenase [Saccharothrix variisporea]|uniref:Isopenicillin N synthase-like dioxygenase n=1 Tax=Saccharothrix variisporea TaxID=543527 RepID=A0A495X1K5_9PSEU|nr:2OG-Fe(II) oxygenase family protein [Saccharothrix variisporea]RKT68061.1 isopenicillin N synthase-like dioxygenase [Saccharothrix variisporea]
MGGVVVVDDFAPVIDLAGRNSGEGRVAIAEAIGRACRRSGFFTIVGHGVPHELVERMHRTTNGFFTSPEEEKDRAASVAGVSGLRRFTGDGDVPGLYEAFAAHVTGDLPDLERAALGDYPATWKVANVWPDSPADFRATWHEYMAAMTALSEDVMRLFALALDLPETFFDAKFDRHVSLLLANFYYPQREVPPPGRIRRESHTDWGTLTILYQQDDLGGLQVRTDTGEWRDLPAVPGSFVVNIGDLMAFWTGGRWASTVHRVVNPERGDAASRISIPFFHLPNHDTSIEPVQPFRGGGVPQFERVTVGQWFSHKVRQTFAPELPAERVG